MTKKLDSGWTCIVPLVCLRKHCQLSVHSLIRKRNLSPKSISIKCCLPWRLNVHSPNQAHAERPVRLQAPLALRQSWHCSNEAYGTWAREDSAQRMIHQVTATVQRFLSDSSNTLTVTLEMHISDQQAAARLNACILKIRFAECLRQRVGPIYNSRQSQKGQWPTVSTMDKISSTVCSIAENSRLHKISSEEPAAWLW